VKHERIFIEHEAAEEAEDFEQKFAKCAKEERKVGITTA
jgi:hypothetical protein